MDIENDEHNYANDLPEYDMEFLSYGPNPIDMPLSPPRTPPPAAEEDRHAFTRELSPFSEATSMTSVDSAESVGYYREEGGRMFSAMPDVPVVLPVDHAEMRRVSGQYDLIKLVTGNMHFEEINNHLLRETDETIRVLDVVSNSPWMDEMAAEYPFVKFVGCNFVPTRHPYRDNIQLEVYNLNEGLRGRDNSFDLIHAEGLVKLARDLKPFLLDLKRLLKPGGILLMCDMEMAVWMRDGSDPWLYVPTICMYTDAVHQALLQQGINVANQPLVGSMLRDIGGFSEVDDTVTSVPVGTWDTDWLQQEIGVMARDNIILALVACHPLWHRLGKSQEEIDKLAQAAHEELLNPNYELFERMFFVFARKEELPS